jgi:hypothetical protein
MGLTAIYTATCDNCGRSKNTEREQEENVRLPQNVLPAGWTQPKRGTTLCDVCSQPKPELQAIEEQIAALTARKAALAPPPTPRKRVRAKATGKKPAE